ncbi:uncharacterized protein LOC131879965 [Tigriopus californicus]|uniref:uncharacterized protein LOC131879965 n=1 Tax=Tigriopus californicus TaxID=6832 RepID=UPI0027DA595B|nr:uncharacterized protein LOC131879965 [Tigriopus californicus]|eukprot:TCALIF_09220-PA protein Name:"Similar to Analgesic polypeptide HC3 (Heteractis crispa)" AED:0.13 eAED:0.13 QI:453/1/1/1/1/1/4/3827/492
MKKNTVSILLGSFLLFNSLVLSRTQEVDEETEDGEESSIRNSTTETTTEESVTNANVTSSNATRTNFTRPKICMEPEYRGRGKGHFQRYLFNETLEKCQKFIYGQSDYGNGNNFETLEECEGVCLGKPYNQTDTKESEIKNVGNNEEKRRTRSVVSGIVLTNSQRTRNTTITDFQNNNFTQIWTLNFMEVEEDSDNSSNLYIRPKFDMINPGRNGTLQTDLELMKDQHYEIKLMLRAPGYDTEFLNSMGNENPFFVMELQKMDMDPNGTQTIIQNLTLFNLDDYATAFSGNTDWNNIRFTLIEGLEGNFSLKFTSRRGTNMLADLQLDDIEFQWIPKLKNMTEEEVGTVDPPGMNSTISPISNSTEPTETTETPPDNTTTPIPSTTTTTPIPPSNTTENSTKIDENESGNVTTAGLGSGGSDDSGGSSATVVVMAVFVVILIVALMGLGTKHYQLLQSVHGAYNVNVMPTQSYDNPSYGGQHMSADRYGGRH